MTQVDKSKVVEIKGLARKGKIKMSPFYVEGDRT